MKITAQQFLKMGDIFYLACALAFLIDGANAFWRMNCAKINTGRMDSIVTPGKVSGHMHTFVGASSECRSVIQDC